MGGARRLEAEVCITLHLRVASGPWVKSSHALALDDTQPALEARTRRRRGRILNCLLEPYLHSSDRSPPQRELRRRRRAVGSPSAVRPPPSLSFETRRGGGALALPTSNHRNFTISSACESVPRRRAFHGIQLSRSALCSPGLLPRTGAASRLDRHWQVRCLGPPTPTPLDPFNLDRPSVELRTDGWNSNSTCLNALGRAGSLSAASRLEPTARAWLVQIGSSFSRSRSFASRSHSPIGGKRDSHARRLRVSARRTTGL